MCNCARLPEVIGELPSFESFVFEGAEKYPEFFQTIKTELYIPSLDWDHYYYKCGECGQSWYIECAPEDNLYPEFALKYQLGSVPTLEEVRSKKQLLCIKAHDGHSQEKCRMQGCSNKKLKGRELCEAHISFP